MSIPYSSENANPLHFCLALTMLGLQHNFLTKKGIVASSVTRKTTSKIFGKSCKSPKSYNCRLGYFTFNPIRLIQYNPI